MHKQITCKQFLENYDSIQIVAQLITFVQNIWTTSVCDSKRLNERATERINISLLVDCITGYNDTNGTVRYSLTDHTIQFIQKKMLLDQCIFNATGVSLSFLEPLSLLNSIVHSEWFQSFPLI